MEQAIQEATVREIREKQPEDVKRIEDMFDIYIQKLILLSNQFSKKEVDKDAVVVQFHQFLDAIKKQMVVNWCTVEKTLEIVKTLENHIVSIGGNLDDVRTS